MTKKLAATLVSLFALASPAFASMTPPVSDLNMMPSLSPPEGSVRNNLSAEFQFLMQNSAPSEVVFDALKSFKILIVPGFKNASMGKSSGDFVDQMNFLKAGGLKEDLDFHMLGSVDGFGGLKTMKQNAQAIARVISSSSRPVILISQSKGSVDALDALITHPDLQPRVHAWFSIQGALWGSQIADGIEAKPRDRFFFHRALGLMGGGAQTIVDLQKSTRLKYMRSNAAQILKLTKIVHVISWASYKEPSTIWWPLLKLDGSYFPQVTSLLSDGVIQLPDALLPQSDYIVVGNVDHADSTLQAADKDRKKTDPPGFNRQQFMNVMALLVLN